MDQDKDTTLLQEDYKQFNVTPDKHATTNVQNVNYVPLSFLNLSQHYGTTQLVNLTKCPTKDLEIVSDHFELTNIFRHSLNSVYSISCFPCS